MFRASLCPSSGAYQLQQQPQVYRRNVVVAVLLVVVGPVITGPTTTCAVLSSVACPTLQYFFTLSHKRHEFRKKKLLSIKCVFWLSLELSSETVAIL
jgi:hypothetical protein